jgi:hypothetical protein
MSVHSMGDLHSSVLLMNMEMLLPSSKHINAYYHLYDVHLDDAAVPAPLLHALRFRSMLRHSSCVSWVLTTTLLTSVLPHLTRGKVFVCSHSEEKAFLMDALQWGRTFCIMVTSSSPILVSNLPFQHSAVPIRPISNMNRHFPCEDSTTYLMLLHLQIFLISMLSYMHVRPYSASCSPEKL